MSRPYNSGFHTFSGFLVHPRGKASENSVLIVRTQAEVKTHKNPEIIRWQCHKRNLGFKELKLREEIPTDAALSNSPIWELTLCACNSCQSKTVSTDKPPSIHHWTEARLTGFFTLAYIAGQTDRPSNCSRSLYLTQENRQTFILQSNNLQDLKKKSWMKCREFSLLAAIMIFSFCHQGVSGIGTGFMTYKNGLRT